jgi:hypothetical protein
MADWKLCTNTVVLRALDGQMGWSLEVREAGDTRAGQKEGREGKRGIGSF